MQPWSWVLGHDRHNSRRRCGPPRALGLRRLMSRGLALAGATLGAGGLGAFAVAIPGAPAWAAEPVAATSAPQLARRMLLTYDVYLGGLHAFSFDLRLVLGPVGYRIDASGGTRGMTAMLYKWDVALTAQGVADGLAPSETGPAAVRPQRYVTVNSGRQEPRTLLLAFEDGGAYSVKQTPTPTSADADEHDDLPHRLPADIVDPLSGALLATQTLADTGRCEQTLPVFDGKRRYNLLIRDAGEARVPKSRYSVFEGAAVMCQFTMERISGFKAKRRYASQWDDDKDEPPTLYLAKVRDGLPPVPVRFTGALALGSMVVHLSKVESDTELASSNGR